MPVAIGPKLSTRTWTGLALRWPLLLARLRRALEEQMPYDVLLVHYKKEQLMAGMLPARLRATDVWAEWGPVPFPLRRGMPRGPISPPRAGDAGDGRLGGHAPLGRRGGCDTESWWWCRT